MLDKVNALGPATNAATDAAGDLEKKWNALGVARDARGRTILQSLAPEIASFLDYYAGLIGEGKFVKSGSIADKIGQFFGAAPATPATTNFPKTGLSSSTAFGSQAEKEAFIRSEAAKRGIDPNVAMSVARSEGFANPVGDNGTSFGAFQLHVTPGGRGNAVGDRFRRETGLDPSDPANERRGITYALDNIKAGGWGPYHGAAKSGIGAWQGINRGGGGSTSTTEIAINGPITINAGPNADGKAIAQQFRDAILKRQADAAQANGGQQ
jgi:hypothetical protein